MNQFLSYLGIIVALFLSVFIAALPDSQLFLQTPATNTLTASSTFSVASDVSLSSFPSEATVATSTPIPITPILKKKITPSVPVQQKTTIDSSPVPPIIPTNELLDASASVLRSALVNIICYVPEGSVLRSTSGSGVIIDPKGIILTNAHIAQYFLLANRGISCSIRSGSPAVKNYNAALIYISYAWLLANANVLTEKAPSGTGEYDFALLAITKSATTAPLPTQFPSLPLAQKPPQKGTPVVIASYAAQFLESNQIQSFLFPTIVFGSVKDVFTFAKNTIDVLSLGGSAAAQEGSSGGGIADVSGTLVGTITTSTIKGDTNTRSLSAITASYIRAEYASKTGKALDILLSEPTSASVANFASKIPELEAILAASLP